MPKYRFGWYYGMDVIFCERWDANVRSYCGCLPQHSTDISRKEMFEPLSALEERYKSLRPDVISNEFATRSC